jgi:CheY-like chemotaxis protein
MVRQILMNLVGNAIKFTPKGAVSISIHATQPEEDNYQLEGEVKDTGIGMDKSTQSKLFQSFSQADNTMARRFGGSGLGLYITKQLCQMMGGDVQVTSELGAGSCFHFQLGLQTYNHSSCGRMKKTLDEIPELPHLSILVAEDNPVNQTIVHRILSLSGCTVTMVTNGLQAVEAVQSQHFDVVLMDGQMPEMDGLQATQLIRQHSKIPIIGITAHVMMGDRERFLQGGMDGYVTKPIEKRALLEEIVRCLQTRRENPPVLKRQKTS